MLEQLDVRLTVQDRPNLDPSARQLLVDAPEFNRLTNDASSRLFGQMPSGPDFLTAEIQGAGVLINYDWVMQIQADTMIRCVRTLFIIVNAVTNKLETAVELNLVTPVDREDRPLYQLLEEEDKQSKRKRLARDLLIGVPCTVLGGIAVLLFDRFIIGGLF